MDKLDDPDKQLDNVITHFKNFFTLSQAEFVFLTDHRFYEHLVKETVKAQLEQHYPPQHTFFTEKLYLRKPEFRRFRQTFYRFAHSDWISKRAYTLPADLLLTEYLLRKDEKIPPTEEESLTVIKSLPLQTLTQLFIRRELYDGTQKTLIESEFREKKGWSNAVAVAEIWASQVSNATDATEFPETRKAFTDAHGWSDHEAIALLYYYREDFGREDRKLIEDHYQRLGSPAVTKYTTVDEALFTLSDLARALCFQTRNHYFDLYNTVYDYVDSYEDGAPVLPLEEGRFAHEARLWSRYQQLLEIAFDSAKETHPSREYFNTLLMESLYKVFDTRGNGDNVLVSDVLFGSNGLVTLDPALDPVPPPAKVEDARISAFTGRDAEKINQAIIRLLRLALAHEAILSPQLETSFQNDKVKPHSISNLQFSWKDNSLSIIRGDDAEQHEQALIEFWDKYKTELEALDAQLTQLWLNAPISGEGARMKNFIGELRTKAEGLRLKTGKVSRPDALALKANLGSTASRNELMPRIILERIKAEDDADILEDVEKSTTQISSILESRKREFESRTKLRCRAMICPRDSECIMYFVASAIPADFDLSTLALIDVPKGKTYLFWYVLGSEIPILKSFEYVDFYFPQSSNASPSKLFADYVQRASLARFWQIIARWQATEYKDKTLPLGACAELIGPINSNSQISQILARPSVGLAINALTQAAERFNKAKFEAWKSYDIEIESDWPSSRAIILLAEHLAKDIVDQASEPLKFQTLFERALLNAITTDTSAGTADSWTKDFISVASDPLAPGRVLLSAIVFDLVQKKLGTVEIDEPKFNSAVVTEFASLLAQHVVGLASIRGSDLRTILSSSDLPVELEKYRRSFKPAPPTNTTPTSPISTPSSSGRIRRSRKPK
jgi:hypothetical protein